MKCNSSEGKDNIADSSTGPSLCLSIENPSRNFKQKVFFFGGGCNEGWSDQPAPTVWHVTQSTHRELEPYTS